MRTVLAMVVAVSLAAGTLSVASAADEMKVNPQQERMKACNTQEQEGRRAEGADASAKSLKGERAQVLYERVLEGREEVLAHT